MHKDIHSVPINPSCEVAFFDQKTGLLAINKPTALKSHPNTSGKIDRLAILLAPYHLENQHYTLPNNEKWYLLNRLDAPTSGLILLSHNLETAEAIRKSFKERTVQKTYLAVLIGKVPQETQTWKDSLKIQKAQEKLRVSRGSGEKIAITEVTGLQYNAKFNLSLVRLAPKTGFTHQLRVQAAMHHFPILNDKTYGNFLVNKKTAQTSKIKRLCLHALSLRVQDIYIKTSEPMEFQELMQ